jgi:hypothetical protein
MKKDRKSNQNHEAPETDGNYTWPDYLYQVPERISFREAAGRWFKKAWYLICHLFHFYKWAELRPPRIDLPAAESTGVLDEALFEQLGLKMYEEANSRIKAVQEKAQKLLGLVGIFTPIYSAFFVYAFNKVSPLSLPVRISLIIIVSISIIVLILSVFAALRSLSVTHFMTPFLLMVLDPKEGKYKELSKTHIGREFMQYANHNQVQANHQTEFLRASQMLFGSAIATLVLAIGLLILSILFTAI